MAQAGLSSACVSVPYGGLVSTWFLIIFYFPFLIHFYLCFIKNIFFVGLWKYYRDFKAIFQEEK